MLLLRRSWTLLVLLVIACCGVSEGKNLNLKYVVHVLRSQIRGYVLPKGTFGYEMRRIVHNGLCRYTFPDLVAVPASSEDVQEIVRVTSSFGLEISVRSGGHSFLCNNIKQGGVHVDMRLLNKVKRVARDKAELGPGSNWKRVLSILKPSEVTIVHGQCLSVGVGGYLLGGGINVVGTSEEYGSGASNVLQFTMVTAEGDLAKVTRENITLRRYGSSYEEVIPDTHDLYRSLGAAGSSYGIVTEFLYKVYPWPETTPAIGFIYVEGPHDLRKLERAALDGRYHVTFFLPYFFHRSWAYNTFANIIGVVYVPRMLRFLQRRRQDPIMFSIVDNRRPADTDLGEAYAFLKSFGLLLAKSDPEFAEFIVPDMFELDSYEGVYLTPAEFRRRGYQAVESANLMGLPDLRLLDDFILRDPVFGFPHKYSANSNAAGCDLCYLIVASTSKPQRKILELTETGSFQIELTCAYAPFKHRYCPKVLKKIKERWTKQAQYRGITLTQYANTPSCDSTGEGFGRRYYGDNYELLLRSKEAWDPENVFHHCQSVGSTDESCCPQR